MGEPFMNARVAAWVGTVTNLILSSDLVDPIVAWAHVPERMIRIKVGIIGVDKTLARQRFVVERVYQIRTIEECHIGMFPNIEASGIVKELQEIEK